MTTNNLIASNEEVEFSLNSIIDNGWALQPRGARRSVRKHLVIVKKTHRATAAGQTTLCPCRVVYDRLTNHLITNEATATRQGAGARSASHRVMQALRLNNFT